MPKPRNPIEYVEFGHLNQVMRKAFEADYTVTLDCGSDGRAEALVCDRTDAKRPPKAFEAPTAGAVMFKVNHWLNTRGARK